MTTLFIWLFINGLGICVAGSSASSLQPRNELEAKVLRPDPFAPDEMHKRNKRLIVPRLDTPPPIVLMQSYDPLPTPQSQQRNQRKGNRNAKKKNGSLHGKDETTKLQKSLTGVERKMKKQGKSKKTNSEYFRTGQSARRLRQHMQHKKKVKQFLQKRIQEQIKQRNQNPLFFA